MNEKIKKEENVVEVEEVKPQETFPPVTETLPEVSIKCRANTNAKCTSVRARIDNREQEGISYYHCVECNGSWVIHVGHRVII